MRLISTESRSHTTVSDPADARLKRRRVPQGCTPWSFPSFRLVVVPQGDCADHPVRCAGAWAWLVRRVGVSG